MQHRISASRLLSEFSLAKPLSYFEDEWGPENPTQARQLLSKFVQKGINRHYSKSN